VDGFDVALFHAASGWYALDAVCPHKGGPLHDGVLADQSVICPLHERRFDLSTGASLDDCDGVKTYRVSVLGDLVYVEALARQNAA
jgi:nitrite reductase (NADH) small subunit